jgi:hypothetical protein
MSAIPAQVLVTLSPRTTTSTTRRIRGWLALALLSFCVQCLAQQQQEPIVAVWKERRFVFNYDSTIAMYSCNALAARVASVLRAVGARDDVQASASNCDHQQMAADTHVMDQGRWNTSASMTSQSPTVPRPELHQSAIVRVRAMMPVEVTDEVLAELKKDKAKRELVARLTGNPAERFNDPAAFKASWQPVTLSNKTTGLEPEECELIDQMSSLLFPKLGVHVVRRNYICDPKHVSLIPPSVEVQALLPVPYGAPQPSLPAGEETPTAPAGDKPQG